MSNTLTAISGIEILAKLAKLFSTPRPRLRSRRVAASGERYDPLSHPDIQRMSLHELADLPFTAADGYRDRYSVEAGSGGPSAAAP